MSIDPSQPRFSGEVRILVQVPAATSYIVLNSRGLAIAHASAQVGRELVHAATSERVSHGGREPEELVLTFDHPVPAGEAVLELVFDGPFRDTLTGLGRTSYDGRWYAFTEFEPATARCAFPSFDEPSQKVPFDVHITTPKGLLAFSNMPETARTDHATPSGTTTTFDFQTSPPLPTYLVAFAVGDFDVRMGQTSPVPIRIITAKGKSAFGGAALDEAAAVTKELADYFGITFPYPKLDLVAVPGFADDAMENAGLITFKDDFVLLDPAHAPLAAWINLASVVAHEVSHQWFGDLVTTAWWDDLWLNEGFATWMQDKVTDLLHPAFRTRLTNLTSLGHVMATDSLRTARSVRQPVASTGEAEEAFDGLTYAKGGAVLGMIEHALGSDVFRKGLEAYMREHAWKNATANDLFLALSQASGTDVGPMAATFLDRPGVPVLSVDMDCNAKPPTLTLTQAPWHLFGDTRTTDFSPWTIPVDLRASDEELRIQLADRRAAYPIPRCLAWVDPNLGAFGYYLYALDGKRWTALATVIEKEPEASRVAFLQSLAAGLRSGGVEADLLLSLLPAFDGDTSRVVTDAEIALLGDLDQGLVTPEARGAFTAYAAARLLPHKRALDARIAKSKRAPAADDVLAREALFRALGELAHDPATLAEATRLALAWLADPATIDGDLAGVAVTLASLKAGPERIDALVAAAKRDKSPSDKHQALAALGHFEDPATLDRGLSVTLTTEIGPGDVFTTLWPALHRPATHAAAMRWVRAHWDPLRAKLSTEAMADLFGLAGTACTKEEIDDDRAFLTPRADAVEGAARPLAEGLETAERCRALRDKEGAAVDRFFKVKGK